MNYKNVYFRIHTPSYYPEDRGWVGFATEEQAQIFQNGVTDLFLNDNWQIKVERNKGCNTMIKDKQELYLHPQSISGVVVEENIPGIENLLSNSNLFRFERTDVYEDVYDLTDEQYLDILKSKRLEIEQDILAAFKTKRSNLYITTISPVNNVLDKYRITRLSHHIGVYSSNNIDWKYFYEIFEELINRQEIITSKTRSGIGYRTITDKERKAKTA